MEEYKLSGQYNRIKDNRKTFAWAKSQIDYILDQANHTVLSYTDFSIKYGVEVNYFSSKLYKYFLFHGNDTFFKNQYKHLTGKEFIVTDEEANTSRTVEYSFPIPIRNINNLKPILLQLFGEQIGRPFNFTVQNIGKNAVKLRDEVYANTFIKSMNKKLIQELMNSGIPFQNQEELQKELEQIPDDVDEFMKMSYKDKYASSMQALLDWYYYRYGIKEITDFGFLDFLIWGEEIYQINLANGKNPIEKISPLNCIYENQYNALGVHDPSWFISWDFLSLDECIERFNLTEQQIAHMQSQTETTKLYHSDTNALNSMLYSMYNTNFLNNKFMVFYVTWKALTNMRYIKKNDDYFIEDLNEYHKRRFMELSKKGFDEQDQFYLQEVWQGVKIGNDIYTGIRPFPAQPREKHNPKHVYLPVAIIKSEGNSLLDDLQEVDTLLKIIWHKVEFLLTQAKGNILAVDLSYIPRQYNYDIDKVMYHLITEGVFMYNSREDGNMNNGGNMIHQIDLGISQALQSVLAFIQLLEKKLMDIAGVNEQRMAQMSGKDNLGVTKAALNQSFSRTEYLYRYHALGLKHFLTILTNYIKEFHKKEKFETIIEKVGELKAQIIRIAPENLLSDYAVFINDVTKEAEVFNSIKMLAHMFIQQQMIDIRGYIAILESENLQIAKAKLELELERKKLEQQEQAKNEQEHEKQLLQIKQQHDKDLVTLNANIQKETAQITEQSEMTKEIERLKIEQERLKIEAEKLFTEREKLNTEMEINAKKLEVETQLKEKELDSKILLEKLKNNTELQKIELQKKLEEMKIQAERDYEQSVINMKNQHELELENIRLAFKERELQAKQYENDRTYQLSMAEKSLQNYQAYIKDETNRLSKYIEMLIKKSDAIEKELDQLRKEAVKAEIKKKEISTEKPVVEETYTTLEQELKKIDNPVV